MRGPAKWQKDTTLVVEMRAAAESAVITAAVGLEAVANHHVLRLADPNSGQLKIGDKQTTVAEVRELSLDERYKRTLPTLLGASNPPASSGGRCYGVSTRSPL